MSPPQGCGEALRSAREQSGLSLQDVSQRLKMPVRVLQALEAGQWDQSGGAVFVRGQLRSYGRLLKLDVEPFLAQSEAVVAPPAVLVSHSHTPRLQYVFESFKRRAVYVVLTLVIATPVWMALRSSADPAPEPAMASLDVVPDASMPAQQGSTSARPSGRAPGRPTWHRWRPSRGRRRLGCRCRSRATAGSRSTHPTVARSSTRCCAQAMSAVMLPVKSVASSWAMRRRSRFSKRVVRWTWRRTSERTLRALRYPLRVP